MMSPTVCGGRKRVGGTASTSRKKALSLGAAVPSRAPPHRRPWSAASAPVSFSASTSSCSCAFSSPGVRYVSRAARAAAGARARAAHAVVVVLVEAVVLVLVLVGRVLVVRVVERAAAAQQRLGRARWPSPPLCLTSFAVIFF